MQIVTSLSFKGQCREAFEFYAAALGGEITAAFPFGDGPPDMPVKPEYKDWLMHCWLKVGDQAIMGADMAPEFAPNIDKPKNGFDVTLHTENIEQARWSCPDLVDSWFKWIGCSKNITVQTRPGFGS